MNTEKLDQAVAAELRRNGRRIASEVSSVRELNKHIIEEIRHELDEFLDE
jgi:hypothetical protein